MKKAEKVFKNLSKNSPDKSVVKTAPQKAKRRQPAKTAGSGIRVGYARVSTDDQHLTLQQDALGAAGCRTMYEESASGKSATRPELEACLKALRPGDTLVVCGLIGWGAPWATWWSSSPASMSAGWALKANEMIRRLGLELESDSATLLQEDKLNVDTHLRILRKTAETINEMTAARENVHKAEQAVGK